MNKFDPITCKLSGSNLLEASAGTGKTYSLSFLYLRLILEKSLQIDQILVTTFTKAAVAELKERIYSYLSEAEAYLTSANAINPTLKELLDQQNQTEQDKSQTIKKLQLAKSQFSHAQIYTIDGFCLQLLKTHYISIQSHYPENIISDNASLIKESYLEIANHNFVDVPALTADHVNLLIDVELDSLVKDIDQIIQYFDYFLAAEPLFQKRKKQTNKLVKQIEAFIQNDLDLATNFLTDPDINAQLKQTSYKESKITQKANWLKRVQTTEIIEDLIKSCDKSNLGLFQQKAITNGCKKGKTIPSHSSFNVADEIVTNSQYAMSPNQILIHESRLALAEAVLSKITPKKAASLTYTYHDTLTTIEQASLFGKISTDLQAALIDEVQDSNLEQLTLFNQLFVQTNKICFFVGDPKQAIYDFRGANIFAYLENKKRVKNHYILETNYRSTQALNDSINTIFNPPYTFQSDIFYTPVQTATQNQKGSKQSLEIVELDPKSKENPATPAEQACAMHIQALLENQSNDIMGTPIRYSDIAVLVTTNNQANKIRRELSLLSIPAAYISNQSVFLDDEATFFYWLLSAINHPDPKNIKTLLLSPMYIQEDPEHTSFEMINQISMRYSKYKKIYQEKGFSIALYQLFDQENIIANLLLSKNGQRSATNFLHIFELLQDFPKTSLYWLTQKLLQKINNSEQQENEPKLDHKDAITISTVHKAKGLDYNIVYLPFINSTPRAPQASIILSHQLKKACFMKDQITEIKDDYLQNKIRETKRVNYVALTRARYKNILFLTKEKDYFLGSIDQSSDYFIQLKQSPFVKITPFTTYKSQHQQSKNSKYTSQTPKYSFTPSWFIDSFSGISRKAEHNVLPFFNQTDTSDSSLLLSFPKGAAAGNALHRCFEIIMEKKEGLTQESLKQTLTTYLPYLKKDNQYLIDLIKTLNDLTQIHLSPLTFSLANLAPNKCSIEMEFLLHLSPSKRQALFRLFDLADGFIAESYLHGFIDLMFFHQGKYYILDYKSNYLGGQFSDYNQANMSDAMQNHRYHLQALIYTIALCKHLQKTLVDFDYDRDIGGTIYLFLRGMTPNTELGIFSDKPDWEKIEPFL